MKFTNGAGYLAGWGHGGHDADSGAAWMIQNEIIQLQEEGRDQVWIEARLKGLDLKKMTSEDAAHLWALLQDAPVRTDFAFVEPSDLSEIHQSRPKTGHIQKAFSGSDAALEDKMLGAWLGRCCGCALGKPVENFMNPHNGLANRARIKAYLQSIALEEYPIRDYIPGSSPAGVAFCPLSQRERIAYMESDDDIRYTIIGQKVLQEKGRDFTSADVMRMWLKTLPYYYVFGDVLQAYRNCAIRYPTSCKLDDADWTWIAVHQNPFREWIGAQIRADSWGYAAPGNPMLAAEFAWRDARISTIKNGIYGEMFVAAMIAAGFVIDDPLAMVEAGLAEIPAHSRLQSDMRQVIDICRRHDFNPDSFEEVFIEVEGMEPLCKYHDIHTNKNAALVITALLLGGRDFEKVISIAVMGGWDTDCNGATAGSIFGAMHGAGEIPKKWSAPLHDTFHAEVLGYDPIAISECARRSAAIARLI